jgi:hypothetical protein
LIKTPVTAIERLMTNTEIPGYMKPQAAMESAMKAMATPVTVIRNPTS